MKTDSLIRTSSIRLLAASVAAAGVSVALVSCSAGDDSTSAADTLTIQVQAAQQPAFEYAAEILKKEHPDVEGRTPFCGHRHRA